MKRHLLKLGVFLLFGAIVNVAVAWGCVVFIDSTQNPAVETYHKFEDNHDETTKSWTAFGQSRIERLHGR